jgi:hypothetical protein
MQPPDAVGRCLNCDFPADQMLYAGSCISCTLAQPAPREAPQPVAVEDLAATLPEPVAMEMAAEPAPLPAPPAELAPAQRGQVLRLAAIGFTSAQIAAAA